MSLSIRRVAAGAVLAVVLAAGVRRPTGDGGAGGSNPHLPPRRRGPGAVLPVRLVDTSPRYVDAATGDEVTLVTPETHHRDETRTAIADPWMLARAALERGPYTLDLRAGGTGPPAPPSSRGSACAPGASGSARRCRRRAASGGTASRTPTRGTRAASTSWPRRACRGGWG